MPTKISKSAPLALTMLPKEFVVVESDKTTYYCFTSKASPHFNRLVINKYGASILGMIDYGERADELIIAFEKGCVLPNGTYAALTSRLENTLKNMMGNFAFSKQLSK